MGIFEEMMQQYQDSHKIGGAKKSDNKYDLKNYFNAGLPKGVEELKKKIRILPPEEGKKTSFGVMYGHTKKINGEYKTFPCLKHEKNEECPFCQAREALLAGGTEEEKELAKDYSARKFYIVKVIDRDNESDGPKFWRFKHNYKNDGILDKIIPIWRNKGDITDPEKGRDLIVELSKSKTPAGKEYTSVSTIMYDDPTPVHEEKTQGDTWINDELTWLDVYSKKPVEYLEAIARGETPKWDSDKGGYVYTNDAESTTTMGGSKKTETKTTIVDPQVNDVVDGDLPF